MTYDALRKGRVSLVGHAYFLTTVTQNRVEWFHELAQARLVIKELRRAERALPIRSLAFVLMPDHLHWLIQLHSDIPLSAIMNRFKGSSARAVNHHLMRTGPVWQRAFHDRAIRDERDIRSAARYLVANPLRISEIIRTGTRSG